jgi:hypothetical protein
MLRFWTAEVGVPIGVVLDACYVVAGNRSGKLYTYVEPRQQISETDADALLHAGEYVFVVLGSEEYGAIVFRNVSVLTFSKNRARRLRRLPVFSRLDTADHNP